MTGRVASRPLVDPPSASGARGAAVSTATTVQERASPPRAPRAPLSGSRSLLTKHTTAAKGNFMALPVPGENGIPKEAIVHGACGSWWTGRERSHCGGCHETFSGLSAFDRHRRGLRCNPPESVGLVAREKRFGVLWGMPAPENGFAWRDAASAEPVTVRCECDCPDCFEGCCGRGLGPAAEESVS